MLTCWIDDSVEQDLKVLDRTLASTEEFPDATGPEHESVLICRQIWEDLSPVWVVIPYATRIRFQSAENRRNPDMVLDLIRTNAALNQRQREQKQIGSVTCVIATREDFSQAARLFMTLNGETGGQANKLTKRESALIDSIASFGVPEVTIAQLQGATGFTNSSIGKLLHGYRSHGKSYTGILEKCPAISFLDRTVTSGDEGYTTMRRTRVYLWDAGLYAAWTKGGCVWLVEDDDENNPPDSPDSPGESMDGLPNQNGDPAGDYSVPDETDLQTSSQLSDKDQDADELRDTGDSPAGDGISSKGTALASVNPKNFFRVDGTPDRRRCSVCGKRPTLYQERMTHERLGQPPRMNQMLCKGCYQRAVSRAIAQIVTLPGVIDPGSFIRRTSSVGRCQVCDLQPAVWSDPGNRVHVCDGCYRRCRDREGSGDPGAGPPVN